MACTSCLTLGKWVRFSFPHSNVWWQAGGRCRPVHCHQSQHVWIWLSNLCILFRLNVWDWQMDVELFSYNDHPVLLPFAWLVSLLLDSALGVVCFWRISSVEQLYINFWEVACTAVNHLAVFCWSCATVAFNLFNQSSNVADLLFVCSHHYALAAVLHCVCVFASTHASCVIFISQELTIAENAICRAESGWLTIIALLNSKYESIKYIIHQSIKYTYWWMHAFIIVAIYIIWCRRRRWDGRLHVQWQAGELIVWGSLCVRSILVSSSICIAKKHSSGCTIIVCVNQWCQSAALLGVRLWKVNTMYVSTTLHLDAFCAVRAKCAQTE